MNPKEGLMVSLYNVNFEVFMIISKQVQCSISNNLANIKEKFINATHIAWVLLHGNADVSDSETENQPSKAGGIYCGNR